MTEPVDPSGTPPLVIVGMHRSGTSLLASLCQASGVDIGEQLLGPSLGNDAGHFEDLDFLQWHERVLKANGMGPEGFVAGGRITVPAGLRREAEELVRNRRSLGRPWGWKNPRTTLMLEFWREILPDAVFVGLVRPPWEVIDSLFRRGDAAFRANPPFALEVWRHYNDALLSFLRRHPDRTFVCELTRVVERPFGIFVTLRDRFGFPLADPPERFRAGMLNAVDPPVIAAAVRQASPEAMRVYDALRGLAGPETSTAETDDPTISAIEAALTLWARLRFSEAEATQAERSAVEAAAINATLAAELHQVRVAMDESVSRGEGLRLDLIRQLAEATERVRQFAHSAVDQALQIEALNAEAAAAVKRVDALQAEAARNSLVEADRRQEIESLRTSLAERESANATLREALASKTAGCESLGLALATAEATADVLRADVERLEAACRENIRFRRQLELDITSMTRSRSWRFTAPLRNFRSRAAAWPSKAADRLRRLIRRAWQRLPLDAGKKHRLREFVFRRMPWVFCWTRSYRNWRAARDTITATRSRVADPTGHGPLAEPPSGTPKGLRVIAMHLPQFHRIPENDAWWGEGFTEWTNVRRGRPLYAGHAQPSVPHPDVGYYDLLEAGTLERQATMAKRFGIAGFCFYYYWFDGRRLLEKPLERMLASGRPDFPFCLCWANENWTRTWDGLDREVLLSQRHSADSDLRFIRDLLPYLRDPRYVRVDGRPLISVYRAGLLSDPAAAAETWRRVCRQEGIGEIHLAAVRSFDKRNPREFGFDAAIQFPPLLIPATDRATDPAVSADESFRGSLFEYEDAVRFSLAESAPSYPMYRGVMPSWDNTPRRQERGTVWMHATPERYGLWLKEAAALTGREQPPERRLIFINAWNEWAEGAYLEPDVRHGYRNLEETAAALGVDPTPARTGLEARDPAILVISHDAHLAGAQMVTLRTVQQWRRAGVPNVRIVCVGGGVLRPAFEAAYPTTVLEDFPGEAARRAALEAVADFDGHPPGVVYSSTVVNGPVLEWIRHLGMPIVTHAHELQKSIDRWAPGEIFEATRRASDVFMAAAPAIRDNLVARHGIAAELVEIVPAHIDCDTEIPDAAEIGEFRRSWNAGSEDCVVFGCGTTDWRKGPDLFCQIAALARSTSSALKFVWAGGDAEYFKDWLAARGLSASVHFLGSRGDVRRLLHAADVFLLSSREDPMPLVALEAAATGLPVVCFDGAGDIPHFVGTDAGITVPMEDIPAATAAILDLARDPDRRRSLGRTGSDRVRSAYDSRVVAGETLRLLQEVAAGRRRWMDTAPVPLVSVIVPNFDHASYLPERLRSIQAQGLDDIEIILLDDCSTDDSLGILEDFVQSEPRARLVASATNSGSTFRQWRKGLAMARGRYVWVAESDDAARPGLLETLVGILDRHPGAVLAYCQSEMIDEHGNSLGQPSEWTADISPDRWDRDYVVAGHAELAAALVHKNTIPNVSAVLFRNTPELIDVIDDGMRLCGDWLAYVRLCRLGDVAYTPKPLNLWRQRTSHARTRPPGELEWEEGRHVIAEAAGILGLDDVATQALVEAFRDRCDEWLAAAGSDRSHSGGRTRR